jgi:hypothetical protein
MRQNIYGDLCRLTPFIIPFCIALGLFFFYRQDDGLSFLVNWSAITIAGLCSPLRLDMSIYQESEHDIDLLLVTSIIVIILINPVFGWVLLSLTSVQLSFFDLYCCCVLAGLFSLMKAFLTRYNFAKFSIYNSIIASILSFSIFFFVIGETWLARLIIIVGLLWVWFIIYTVVPKTYHFEDFCVVLNRARKDIFIGLPAIICSALIFNVPVFVIAEHFEGDIGFWAIVMFKAINLLPTLSSQALGVRFNREFLDTRDFRLSFFSVLPNAAIAGVFGYLIFAVSLILASELFMQFPSGSMLFAFALLAGGFARVIGGFISYMPFLVSRPLENLVFNFIFLLFNLIALFSGIYFDNIILLGGLLSISYVLVYSGFIFYYLGGDTC